MRKSLPGYMTAEAAVMFPVLIFITATLMYLIVFVYDSILIRTDLGSLVASIKCSKGDYYYAYREITGEHAYLAAEGPEIELIQRGSTYTIKISCKWIFPLFSGAERKISASEEVELINPFKVMLYTEDIINTLSGGNNDSDQNN